MKNVSDLRAELVAVFNELRGGAMDPGLAKEINNTAGKIIKSVQLELTYADLRKQEPTIAFLESTDAEVK
jgi:hypothetical protein